MSKQIKDISAISTNELTTILYVFNDTAVDYPRDKFVHTLFEEQAARTPDKTAVIAFDKTLTYAELNEQANRIAHGLIERGVGVGDIVAFALPRRSYLIAAMFGILKTGALYLPIDPDYPQDRIDYILSDSSAKLFLTESIVEQLLNNHQTNNPAVSMTSDNMCYCIYTSGTTGIPKGVLIRHRNLINICSSSQKNPYQFTFCQNCDVLLSTAKCCFDAFAIDYALVLLNGKTFVLAQDNENANGFALSNLIEEFSVTAMQTTPSIMKTLLLSREFQAAISQLNVIILAAEEMTPVLYSKIREHTKAAVFNGYGPTEATIGASIGQIHSDEITIGKPIANTQIYIVDKYMQPVPIGATGELCIAGDGVGAGYLNRPALTAEKFVDNPFGEGKLYKTGDLAYWREDGNIVYVGRNDFQVKIRGLRIELGEIENAISAIDGISQAVAVVRKDENGRQLICAFYTGAELPAKEIRSVIGQKLPKYMLPHVITHLDTLPLTTSGKINRKALPEVDLRNLDSETEYVAPVGELETRLAALMEQILQVSPIGRDDDFFDLGGDSLKAIELIAEAHSEGIYLELQSVFDHPTVRRLARSLTESEKGQVSYADVDFTDINRLLAGNTISQIGTPSKATIGNMLLAGATGFLGVHLLADFLDHENGIAYCLIRGKDQADSEARLASALQFYFGETYAGNSRIRVICADLQKDHFGLSRQVYEQLLTEIDTVINAAATVKHYGSYQFFYETNVETVKRMIDCCMVSGAKLIQISTHSISGDRLIKEAVDGCDQPILPFHESDIYIGQSLDNVYIHSKFEAEKLVLDAMSMGLKANIMRMGNLTNRATDGLFQKNYTTNAFLRRLKAFVDIRLFPDYLIKHFVEFTPVDEAARAIMTITRHFSEGQTVFHICSDKLLPFDTLLEYLRELGYPINAVDGVAFADALRKTAYQPDRKYIFETFADEMDENENLVLGGNIYVDNSFTVEYLRRLGFEWGKIDLEYLRQYMDYFKRLDYWG